MTPAEHHLAQGQLDAALAAVQQQVRQRPGDVRLRTFLFQLLAVMQQWERAAAQLKVCGELDPATLAMVATYREALQAEAVRHAVFQGRTTPVVIGQPGAWVGLLIQALAAQAQGDHAGAAQLRENALEQAPACAGELDGEPFEWLADADSRLGPVLEVVLQGRYAWLPLQHVRKLTLEAPSDLRDMVWLPAQVELVNGGQTVALVPTRYTGLPLPSDLPIAHRDALWLARRTEWQPLAGSDTDFAGLGQRMLTSSVSEKGLLDVREIVFDTPASVASVAEDSA